MANQSAVGGNIAFPNLQEVADLFRSLINDSMNSTTGYGTGTGNSSGLIMGNSNPDLMTIMSSSIRTLFSDLRNIGEPQLLIDNYILTGLPALTTQDPTVQVGLNYAGFFDGYQWHPQWTLPIGLKRVLAVWQRQSGTANSFQIMQPAPFGIGGCYQGIYMGQYEMRGDTLWMTGATQSIDLRIRGRIGFPTNYNVATLNYETTYIPILSCADAVVAKMLVRYSMRFAPELLPMAKDFEKEELGKIKLETVRAMQGTENQRQPFGDEACADFSIGWSWL